MRSVRRVDGLELISHTPSTAVAAVPLLFVHGAFAGAWCWDEYLMPYLAHRGHVCHALSLRGHGASAGRENLNSASVADYESDVLRVAAEVGGSVIAVGHSMGAMVVQRCLRHLDAAGAILMTPPPVEGLLVSSAQMAMRDPALLRELTRIQLPGLGKPSVRQLRRAVFSDRLPEPEVARHLARMQPESQRALFDLSWPQHWFIKHGKPIPTLVLLAQHDAFFPPVTGGSMAAVYGGRTEVIPDIAHAMMLEPDWRGVADRMVDWIAAIAL